MGQTSTTKGTRKPIDHSEHDDQAKLYKWKQYTKFHSLLFSKYNTDYRQECTAKSAFKQ